MSFEDRAAFYRSRAAIALAQDHWGEAEQQLQAHVAISPNDAIAWNNLGVALEHQHKKREAVEAYARAAALSHDSRLPGGNLVREMQRYLGFAAALVLFRVAPISPSPLVGEGRGGGSFPLIWGGVFSSAGVEITQKMRRAMHTFGPAAALVFAALVVLALFLALGQGLTPIHGSGGCSGIPLVNGQPAYRCANIPVPPGQ